MLLPVITELQMMHGRNWSGQPVRGWHASEKFDGVRGYWDGSQMWTRGGNAIELPDSLRRDLPEGVSLDGEIWFGRGQFESARLAVTHGRWSPAARYIVFDSPSRLGSWPVRLQHAANVIDGATAVRVIGYVTLTGIPLFEKLFADVLAVGGEGLMLRNPKQSTYDHGRSGNLLKVKRDPALARGVVRAVSCAG